MLFQEPRNNVVLSEDNTASYSVIENNEVLSEDNYFGPLFNKEASYSVIEKTTESFSTFKDTSVDLSPFGETNVGEVFQNMCSII